MKKLENLSDLFQEQTKELYNSTHQQIDALSKLIEKTQSPDLKKIISKHYDRSKSQKERLEKTFQLLGVKPEKPEMNPAVDNILKKGFDRVNNTMKPSLKDVGIIASLQNVYHYGMAEYGTACAFAQKLGKKEIAEVLHQSLDEIKTNDKELSKIADEKINVSAVV